MQLEDNSIADPAADDEVATRLTILRDAGLSVEDPEAIPNRHHPIPAGMEPVRLLQDYDTSRTTGRKVRCAACAHHQAHNRGFVAEMPDGRPALIGINCGERHFGDGEWGRMHADLRREQDDAYYEARVLPALNQIRASFDRAVIIKGFLKKFEAEWQLLKSSLPDAFDKLHSACRTNEGYLDRYVKRTVAAAARDGTLIQREQIDTVRFGKVPDPRVFLARSAVFDLDSAIGTLRTAKLKLEQSADTKARREAFTQLARGRSSAEEVVEQIRGYTRNTQLDWWFHAVRFLIAEGVYKNGRLLGRTINCSDEWDRSIGDIPQCASGHIARAEELVSTWPSAA